MRWLALAAVCIALLGGALYFASLDPPPVHVELPSTPPVIPYMAPVAPPRPAAPPPVVEAPPPAPPPAPVAAAPVYVAPPSAPPPPVAIGNTGLGRAADAPPPPPNIDPQDDDGEMPTPPARHLNLPTKVIRPAMPFRNTMERNGATMRQRRTPLPGTPQIPGQ